MMSKMADLMMEIEDLWYQDVGVQEIAERLGVPRYLVVDAVSVIQREAELAMNEERDQFLSDAEADGDVLASAGWGVDEDYVMDNDFYD
jgi:DNA-binding transcriptional regulator LsrR (DeoR family)